MATNLKWIGERAAKDRRCRFTSLYHHVYDIDHLRACYREMKGDKAPGIDGVTKETYGENLEENLQKLSGRLAQMGYRPKPVKRVYIRKEGSGRKRPLGIPCFEDKLVQRALVKVLEQIYEADFLPCSYGYRPGRKQHDAIDQLARTIQQQKVSYVTEADIEGFFDHVKHEWMKKFLKHRIADQRVLRMIQRFLKAGVMEDGLIEASEEGTPQGGVLSALLSNIYLHYALDLWVERRYRRSCKGEIYYYRYADDFVSCFQYLGEAERFLRELERRLASFGLKLQRSKSGLVRFGRFANDARPGGGKAGTFDFLGFTFYCGQTRQGSFKVKRRTSRKKLRNKLKAYNQWLRKRRNGVTTARLLEKSKQILQGHLQYYAITDNGASCEAFKNQMQRRLYKWLNRRSQRRSYTWRQFFDLLNWYGWPRVRIRHRLCPYCRT